MEGPALEHLVRPRVLEERGGGRETVLLEDALEQRLARRDFGPVLLEGPPGSGRRTALHYLRLRFADRPEIALGPASAEGAGPAGEECVRVVTTEQGELVLPSWRRLALAPWGRDEWIEYLLANQRDACASVMARLERSQEHLELGGNALLWTAILDELAGDPALPDDLSGLRRALRARCSGPQAYARACQVLRRSLLAFDDSLAADLSRLGRDEPALDPFLGLASVRVLLAAEGLVQGLLDQESEAELPRRGSAELLRIARPLLQAEPDAGQELRRRLEHGPVENQPSAASFLHLCAADSVGECLRSLAERGARLPSLVRAELSGLEAPGIVLPGILLSEAHLRSARLDGADLSRANLSRGELPDAALRGARLAEALARGAVFSRADLRGAVLDGAQLSNARLDEARLEGASLRQARLEGADLRRALLDHADLAGCVLTGAVLEQASLVETDLTGALLDRTDLRAAHLATRRLSGASLVGSHLEGLALEAPDLSGADLADALLTGTRFARADLRGARLAGAGLAQIQWEGADLRDADLSHASFHLGSSRSGLVLHAPASWGTRTGFYAEELREQGFRPPEELRKADLRRADLRGAKIQDTDFYLVDLRQALYTPEQAKHLRASGAIL
jgi:uncharacterized protein YjbI with pentapeptide repeats